MNREKPKSLVAHRAATERKPTRKEELAKRGLNTVDMRHDGQRWCMLHTYGSASGSNAKQTIQTVFAAWGVVESYLITDAEVTFQGGPKYMLRFQDGTWRYCSVGGISGPPTVTCWANGYEGATGKIAWVRNQLALAEDKERHARAQLKEAEDLANVHRTALKEALEAHERGSKPGAGVEAGGGERQA